ncbi:hypothetical protein PTKIN_Ptkin14bG0100700 [Pterospermum kingtungense]
MKIEVRPDFITDLHNLQTLLLYSCRNLKKLPKDVSKLISLECLNIEYCDKLKYLPKGLGELTSLQLLPRFIVNTDEKESSTSATLNELRGLNCLRGKLDIVNLEMVRNLELESKEANLHEKKNFESLKFEWRLFRNDSNNEKHELLLDNLEPHPNLKKLQIRGYQGVRVSSWLSTLTNLVRLEIKDSHFCQQLPRLDHLQSLESLSLAYFSALEYIADGGDPCSSISCSTSTTTMNIFPSLKELRLVHCSNLKGWWRRKNQNEGSTSELPWFPSLSTLSISNCSNLASMPLFPSLVDGSDLFKASIRPFQQTLMMKSNNSSTSSSRSGSTAPPLSTLKELILKEIDHLETLPEEFLLNLTSLEYLKFEGCNKLESPSKRTHCLTSLQELVLWKCPNLTALPDWTTTLPSLETIQIFECSTLSERCQKETGIQWPLIAQVPNIYIEGRWVQRKYSLMCVLEEITLLNNGADHDKGICTEYPFLNSLLKTLNKQRDMNLATETRKSS